MKAAARIVLAIVLVLALAAGGVALASWTRPVTGDAGAFPVVIAGAQPREQWNGTVALARADATALAALEAACARAGLAVETQDYPGMGTYVRAVGDERASGASGWIYEVQRDGAWRSGDRAADHYALRAGDIVRWSWTEGGRA